MSMAVVIANGIISAEIDPFGAQLTRVSGNGTEYLWDGNPEIWPKHAPVLFPFVGRLVEGRYISKGRSYDMKIHGFANNIGYEVNRISDAKAEFILRSSDETLAMYPYHFLASVVYELSGSSIYMDMNVENTGTEEMRYGYGGHAGFNVPLEKGLEFTDYSISLPDASGVKRVVFSPSCFPLRNVPDEDFRLDGNAIRLTHDLFDDDAVVLRNTGYRAVLSACGGERSVEVLYEDAPFLAIWHCVGKAVPFVCIEPWWTLPGYEGEITDIDKRDDYLRLSPGEKRTHRMVYTLR